MTLSGPVRYAGLDPDRAELRRRRRGGAFFVREWVEAALSGRCR
jgi:hypothetical protein